MDRNLVLWLAGGAGVVLLYAAYKGKSPSAIITSTVSGAKQGKAPPAPTPVGSPGAVGAIPSGSTVAMVNGQNMIVDQYGNPVTTLAAAYQTTPATYIPPNVSA